MWLSRTHSVLFPLFIIREGVWSLYWWIDIGALADHPNIPERNPNATVTSITELLSLDVNETEIIVDNGVSDRSFTELDLSRFSKLKRLEIGDNCFTHVEKVKLIGLGELESVVIGMKSFTQYKNGYDSNSRRHFYLRDCPLLRELRIDRYSFSDYMVFFVKGVPSLEVIEIGDIDEWSYNFYYASLELKSILILNKWLNRHAFA